MSATVELAELDPEARQRIVPSESETHFCVFHAASLDPSGEVSVPSRDGAEDAMSIYPDGVKQYSTTEVPALGRLLAAVEELSEAGIIKWRNHVDQTMAHLQLHLTNDWRSEKDDRSGIHIVVSRRHDGFDGGHETGIPMSNHSQMIVGGATKLLARVIDAYLDERRFIAGVNGPTDLK